MKTVDVFLKRVKELSGKECEFGFINDYAFKSMVLAEGRFILQPESQESRTIGINHRKERNRKLTLYYVISNDAVTNSKEVVEEIEELLKVMEQDREILLEIINFDYYYHVRNAKEEESNLTGLVVFEINLDIKER
ncbi:hypothetical protein [Sebaldella sp. S0638]|uniref:hypothetical protein n=1 Tax=Sebaldella sp. S0638 TaxID=2957809 RepID=UPI0020A07B48|nr:hypothetical protein [Sebaldella sp. S0638]MCP1226664.1 hypothetical protein [Sebaldella sp. S0638]